MILSFATITKISVFYFHVSPAANSAQAFTLKIQQWRTKSLHLYSLAVQKSAESARKLFEITKQVPHLLTAMRLMARRKIRQVIFRRISHGIW